MTFEPNSQPAPLGLMAQVSTSSGSDQTRSQNAPLCGISWFRSMVRIWSNVLMSGESPPWTHSTCSSINYQKFMCDDRKIVSLQKWVSKGFQAVPERILNLQLRRSACQTLWCNTARRLRCRTWFGTHLRESRTHRERNWHEGEKACKQKATTSANTIQAAVLSTYHKNRTLVWFACFRDSLVAAWCDLATLLWAPEGVWRSPSCNILYRQSLPEEEKKLFFLTNRKTSLSLPRRELITYLSIYLVVPYNHFNINQTHL